MKTSNVLFIPSCHIGPGLNELSAGDTLLRLERGLDVWKRGEHDVILVTGGIFYPRSIQTVPASVLMKEWLVRHGVPEDRVLAEDRSRDTYENISMGLEVLRRAGFAEASITIVTHWAHAIRFWLTFWKAYRIRVQLVVVHHPFTLETFVCEPFFILHHLIYTTGDASPFARWNRRRRSWEL